MGNWQEGRPESAGNHGKRLPALTKGPVVNPGLAATDLGRPDRGGSDCLQLPQVACEQNGKARGP